ncbi:hypothetical protein [Cryptosporangium japonicum]|uniref:STAS domain-containing protein n=1 Tax=Cryptosporangium japonicum TaxID=80872 RepID=A0ABP3D1D8_9ACTN
MTDHLDLPTPPDGIRLSPGFSYDQLDAANGDLLLAAYTRVDTATQRAALQLLGDIDVRSEAWFRDRLAAAIKQATSERQRPAIHLDLHSIAYFSAAAAGIFAGLTATGTTLVIHRPSRIASRVLTLSGVLPRLHVDPAEPPL